MGNQESESKITPKPQKSGKPFYLDMPYQALMVPSKVTRSKIMSYPLGDVFIEFYEKIKQEEGDINLRILGIALQSAAKLHRSRVSGLLRYKRKWDSQDEKLEKKLAEKEKKKKIKRKKKPLKEYMEDPETAEDSEEFYDALLTAMKREEKRRKKKKKSLLTPEESLTEEESVEKPSRKEKRKRRIKIEKLKDFEGVQIDKTRANVDVLINEVRKAILALCTKKGNNEIQFSDILRKKIEQTEINLTDRIAFRLEQIRIFMSLLYLVREGYIEAYQDLDTSKITVEAERKSLERKFELQEEDATTL